MWIDTFTGLRGSAACSDFLEKKLTMAVSDPWARKWLREDDKGRRWAEDAGFEEDELVFYPDEECRADSPRPILALSSPDEGQVIISGNNQSGTVGSTLAAALVVDAEGEVTSNALSGGSFTTS